MAEEKIVKSGVWRVISILSIVAIGFSFFWMALSGIIFEAVMLNSGSLVTWADIGDAAGVNGILFIIRKSDWAELWLGIFGLFSAWGLKQGSRFAWKFGVLWSIMLIAQSINLVIQEVVLLGWSTVCLSTVEFMIIGVIGLASLYRAKKDFT